MIREKIPKVAIVHYWLVNLRGGEKIVEVLGDIFPQAHIYTIISDPKKVSQKVKSHKIATSFIQKLPFAKKLYKEYIPLHPFALEQFNFNGFDLVISSESGFAKGIILPPNTCHICYCHSPPRYLWNMYHEYRDRLNVVQRIIWSLVAFYLRQWDYIAAQRVDHFIANSINVQKRIKRYYMRESEVIRAPVEYERFRYEESEGYYLCLGELVDYKRIDIAIKAFNKTNKKLIIVGDGPARKALLRLSGSNIKVLGRLDDREVVEYYSRCKALIFPGEEDFGITPLEAMASGKPVIAFSKGGALETIINGETGVLFNEQTPESLLEAVRVADRSQWDVDRIRKHAKRFDSSNFKERLEKSILTYYDNFQIERGPQ